MVIIIGSIGYTRLPVLKVAFETCRGPKSQNLAAQAPIGTAGAQIRAARPRPTLSPAALSYTQNLNHTLDWLRTNSTAKHCDVNFFCSADDKCKTHI